MQVIQPPQRDELAPCPYLPAREKQFQFFLAHGIDARELSDLLAAGWRKFGLYYFRPACPGCRQCIPLRVRTGEFSPSRSQRRITRKNSGLRVSFGPLRYSERIFDIYRDHARTRFAQEVDEENFLCNFYLPSCPSLQVKIHRDEELIAVGFLDRGEDCLSSVYFCFDPRFDDLNLGTFGALKEIAYARELGLPYYYLGYYVADCGAMAYKDRFRPREHFHWDTGTWREVFGKPGESLAAL
jgi:arginyl-tRNA--protein-N-Asp/Glu arginylyltransferase